MREPPTFLPSQTAVVHPGRVAPVSRPGVVPLTCHRKLKGGDRPCYVFERDLIPPRTDTEDDKIYQENTSNSRHVNELIRAAAMVRERGQILPLGEDPQAQEELGIMLNIIRRRKKISIETVARKTEIAIEELIACEAGALSHVRTCQVVQQVAKAVGIEAQSLLNQIHSR